MDRRRFLLAGALAAPLVAEAQHARKVYRICSLSLAAPAGFPYGDDRLVRT
jgi:hypothetical protein